MKTYRIATLAAATLLAFGAAQAQNATSGTSPGASTAPQGTMTPDSSGGTVTPQGSSMPAEVVPSGSAGTADMSPSTSAGPSSGTSGSRSSLSPSAAIDSSTTSVVPTRAEVKAETREKMRSGSIPNGDASVPNQHRGDAVGLSAY